MFDTSKPFTFADARQAGMTRHQLGSDRFHRLARGVYIASESEPSIKVRSEAALIRACKDAYLTHSTAAAIRGFPVPADPLIHITVPTESDRRQISGIRFRVRARGEVVNVHGLPLSSLRQNFVELSSTLSLVDAVAVGDHILRIRKLTVTEFWEALEPKDRRVTAKVVALMREGAESPMETRTRLLLTLAGLPEPQLNVAIDRYRADMSWQEPKLIVEYDGRYHIEGSRQWQADLRRRERLESLGWRVIVLTAADIFTTPGETLERVHSALLQRRQPRTPRHLKRDWIPHFVR